MKRKENKTHASLPQRLRHSSASVEAMRRTRVRNRTGQMPSPRPALPEALYRCATNEDENENNTDTVLVLVLVRKGAPKASRRSQEASSDQGGEMMA